jgi:hypothetical protein
MDRQLQARIAPITDRLWMLAARPAKPSARKAKATARPARVAAPHDAALRAAA